MSVTVINIPPLGVRREPAAPKSKPHISLKMKMEQFFREELLRPRSPIDTLMLNVMPDDPQIIRLQKSAPTAMAAQWVRGPQLEVAAITVILGGIDRADDDAVLAGANQQLLGNDDRKEVQAALTGLFNMIRQQPRPCTITIHLDERSYDSVAVRVGAQGLGDAFFNQFGVGSDAERE